MFSQKTNENIKILVQIKFQRGMSSPFSENMKAKQINLSEPGKQPCQYSVPVFEAKSSKCPLRTLRLEEGRWFCVVLCMMHIAEILLHLMTKLLPGFASLPTINSNNLFGPRIKWRVIHDFDHVWFIL